jgi:hypothetical protein
MSRRACNKGGYLTAIATPVTMVTPNALSPGLRIMFLIRPTLILMAAMGTTLLEDSILKRLGMNDVLGGWHRGRQTGAGCGIRFAQIPPFIRQVQELTFPFETATATYARPLLLLEVRLKPPASCSLALLHAQLDHSYGLSCLRRGRAPRQVLHEALHKALPHVQLDHLHSLSGLHQCKAPRQVLCEPLHRVLHKVLREPLHKVPLLAIKQASEREV